MALQPPRPLIPLLLVVATALAYHNSLANPFFFDDLPAIVDNADGRTLWPLAWHGSLSSRAATPLPCSAALLWLLHPLQSPCINYIVQRSESPMALCCLTALYTALRALGGRTTTSVWPSARSAAPQKPSPTFAGPWPSHPIRTPPAATSNLP